MSKTWRCRLLSAALFVVAGCLAVVAMIAIVASGPARPEEPPLATSLPSNMLAAERTPAASTRTRPAGAATRRLIDVMDRQAARPARIEIRAIGVSASVGALGREHDGTMQTPGNWEDAGWYEPGYEPGERGPAVIAGHVDSRSGPAVFYRLGELRRGDLIRISRTDGSVVRFRVEGLERWPKAMFPTRRVFGRTPVSTLRLVTCSGSFDSSVGHYNDNTIVYAVRVRERSAPSSADER